MRSLRSPTTRLLGRRRLPFPQSRLAQLARSQALSGLVASAWCHRLAGRFECCDYTWCSCSAFFGSDVVGVGRGRSGGVNWGRLCVGRDGGIGRRSGLRSHRPLGVQVRVLFPVPARPRPALGADAGDESRAGPSSSAPRVAGGKRAGLCCAPRNPGGGRMPVPEISGVSRISPSQPLGHPTPDPWRPSGRPRFRGDVLPRGRS